jgi:AcrR family transcriptional regulator
VAETKETLKLVSIDLFYKKGYFATSISDIARAAGIQKSSIYYHFATKEDILLDILRSTLADLIANLEHTLNNVSGSKKRMREAILAHTLFHLDRQKEVIVSDSELRGLGAKNYKDIIKMRDEYEHRFQALIRDGMDEHIFENRDFKILSFGIITMCTAISLWYRPHGRLDKQAIAEIYTDFIMAGLTGNQPRAGVKSTKKGRR